MLHEVVDAYAMFLAEESVLPCTMLDNDVGLGKTSTCLALCAMGYRRCVRVKENGEPFIWHLLAKPSADELRLEASQRKEDT